MANSITRPVVKTLVLSGGRHEKFLTLLLAPAHPIHQTLGTRDPQRPRSPGILEVRHRDRESDNTQARQRRNACELGAGVRSLTGINCNYLRTKKGDTAMSIESVLIAIALILAALGTAFIVWVYRTDKALQKLAHDRHHKDWLG